MNERRGSTGNTPHVEDNLLGLSTQQEINEAEAKGIIEGEKFLLGLDENTVINAQLILQIHKTAFGHLYKWAGKWRASSVKVGPFIPPEPHQIPNLMYQFTDELNHRTNISSDTGKLVSTLAYCHHRMVYIHPFPNGNGRMARLLTNLLAYKNGYRDINLYHRTGEKREIYIAAIRKADSNDFTSLEELIRKELVMF